MARSRRAGRSTDVAELERVEPTDVAAETPAEQAIGAREAYEAALIAYADEVPPREQVPSVREVRSGTVEYEFRPEPPPPTLVKPGKWQRFVADLKLLDPRSIATRGSMYPLAVLSALSTAGAFGDVSFQMLLFKIQVDMGVDFTFIFAVLGMMDLVSTLMAPAVGYLADRMKRVYMVRFGTLVDGVCVFLTALAPNPLTIALSRVGGSLAASIYTPAAVPLVIDYFPPEKRARVFGFQSIVSVVWNVVMVLVMVYCVYINDLLSWRQVMFGAAIITTTISLATFRIKEPIRGEVDRRALGASEEVAKRQQKPATWREAWRTCASIGTLRKLWFATPFLYIGQRGIGYVLYFAVQSKIAEAAANSGGGGGFGGSLFANPTLRALLLPLQIVLPQMLALVITPIAVGVADRLLREHPNRIMVYFGLIMATLGFVSMSGLLAPSPLVIIPVSMITGALAGLIAPAQGVLLSVVLPSRVRGQGFQTVAPFKLAGVVAFISLGALIQAFGPTTVAFMLLPLLLIGAAILISSGADVRRDMHNALAASLADEESQRARAHGRSKMIVMRNVGVFYDSAQVLFDVNFDLDDGELVAVLGTNGAGKSTLLKAIAGLHEPAFGAIFLDGEDITHKPAYLNARDGLVFLPGGRAIFPTLTVSENLRAAAWLYKEDEGYVRRRTDEILEFFPILRERLGQQAGDLSGGEQQMLALGQAFLMQPRLLMIDELSLGLAPTIVQSLLEIVRAIHAQGTTVLLVEQSVNVALTVATRAVFMDKGEIRFDGLAEDLVRRTDLVRAVFLGQAGGTRLVGPGRRRRLAYGETPERVLAVEDVHVSYGGVKALDGVSLEVIAGEVVGIIGPNGAGKTTLFDVISGFTPATFGRVRIGADDASSLPPNARAHLGLARSFQDTRLFQSLTVRETIAVALQRRIRARNPILAATWARSVRKAERSVSRRVEYLVDLLNLRQHADKFIGELSTGTRRMVDVACAMAAEPRILLLDEPSSGLAQAEIEVFGPVIQQLGKETGCGVLVIEHDIPLIMGMSDRLIGMELGRIIASGAPEEVANDPRMINAYLSASDEVIKRSGAFHNALTTLGAIEQGHSSSQPLNPLEP